MDYRIVQSIDVIMSCRTHFDEWRSKMPHATLSLPTDTADYVHALMRVVRALGALFHRPRDNSTSSEFERSFSASRFDGFELETLLAKHSPEALQTYFLSGIDKLRS
jgi:hypothetical protein